MDEPYSPDTITIETSHTEEVPADRADVHVIIRGASLVTGTAALSKAREVAQLVAGLRQFGLTETNITLSGIHADVSTGMLGRISTASYSLTIHCARLDSLADILGVITAQKNTTVSGLSWGYFDLQAARHRWLEQCIEQANALATRIAAGLGVQVIGVHRFIDFTTDTEDSYPHSLRGVEPVAGVRARSLSDDLGLAVSHSKVVTVTVKIDYRISPLTDG